MKTLFEPKWLASFDLLRVEWSAQLLATTSATFFSISHKCCQLYWQTTWEPSAKMPFTCWQLWRSCTVQIMCCSLKMWRKKFQNRRKKNSICSRVAVMSLRITNVSMTYGQIHHTQSYTWVTHHSWQKFSLTVVGHVFQLYTYCTCSIWKEMSTNKRERFFNKKKGKDEKWYQRVV